MGLLPVAPVTMAGTLAFALGIDGAARLSGQQAEQRGALEAHDDWQESWPLEVVKALQSALILGESTRRPSAHDVLTHEEWTRAFEEVAKLEKVVLSDDPRIFYFDNFVIDEEAEHIKHVSEPLLQPDGESGYVSEVPVDADPILRQISARMYAATGVDNHNHGTFRVRRYLEGHGHGPHTDWWSDWITEGRQNLVLTMNMYLSETEKGGETEFPVAGVAVPVKKGRMAVWWTCNREGTIDDKSQHQGNVVEKGEKWLASTFVYNSMSSCFDGTSMTEL
eukprot:gnl/TRDRNA2_/TRDRNA2_193500_c0_seq1.p1 gnl/TRDRNA2_/TRDRNA2_193500_c0~~gnl/TRDRNA2_/TRDRNA2_193500_c0_seq1.p1  ORF type:complete len:279 (+),score=41.64 gnl/TRDRNA2_/TRDRNA2_193500_c0_seq1:143-979(+)